MIPVLSINGLNEKSQTAFIIGSFKQAITKFLCTLIFGKYFFFIGKI